MKKKMKRILGILLTFVMIVGQMQGMSLTVYAKTLSGRVSGRDFEQGDIFGPDVENIMGGTFVLEEGGYCDSNSNPGTSPLELAEPNYIYGGGSFADMADGFKSYYPYANDKKVEYWLVDKVEGGKIYIKGYELVQNDTPFTDAVNYRSYNSTGSLPANVTLAANAGIQVESDTLKWAAGKAYVVSGTVTIDSRITVNGTEEAPTKLILLDGCDLTVSKGINLASGKELEIYVGNTSDTITGSGKLNATGGSYQAGIGGGISQTCGKITINGGTIIATGDGGAGIGGGRNGDGGTVIINAGTVTATGGGAGIGGGSQGNGGTVIINAGTVTATGGGAGIGGGGNQNSQTQNGGTVTINGGTVTATGGTDGAGIGGGYRQDGGTVTINGGTVTATGGQDRFGTPMGIGKGSSKDDNGTLTLGTGVTLETSTDNENWTDTTSTIDTRTKYMRTTYVASSHTHNFTYSASGATITATCSEEGCTLPESSVGAGDHVATLTISANGGTHDGTTAYGATITDANSIQGDAKVQYQKKTDGSYGTATETAPTDAGEYKASITVGGATASVEYTIAKADPTVTEPTTKTLTYTGTAQELVNAGSATGGTMYYAVTTENTAPTDDNLYTTSIPKETEVGTYYVWYKAVGDINHSDSKPASVKATIEKAAPSITAPTARTLTYTGSAQALVTAGTATGGTMQYAVGDADGATQPYTTSIPTATNAGTYYVWYRVTGDADHNDSAAVCVKVVISEEGSGKDDPTPSPVPTPVPVANVSGNDTVSIKNLELSVKGAQTLSVGEEATIKAAVTGKGSDASLNSVNWVAPSGHVVVTEVQADGSLKVKAVGPGTAFVTALCGGMAKTVKYTVKQPVNKAEASLNAITLSVKEKYRICVNLDAPTTDKFFYATNDKKVCAVNGKGIIAAKGVGTTTVDILAGEKKNTAKKVASITVTVKDGAAAAVEVKDVSINYVGNKNLYTGEMAYTSTLVNGGANNGGQAVKYSFSAKGIVKIDAYGHLTAKKAGKVTVTASCGGKEASVELTVQQPLKTLKVNKTYVNVKQGKAKTVTLSVKTSPAQGKSDIKAVWSVANEGNGVKKISDENGKAVFEVSAAAKDTVVTATVTDSLTGKIYTVNSVIDVN